MIIDKNMQDILEKIKRNVKEENGYIEILHNPLEDEEITEDGNVKHRMKIDLPQPILSIVAICSEEDKRFLPKWLKWLPKDPRIELVVLFNKRSTDFTEKLIQDQLTLKIIDHTFIDLDFADLRNRAKKYAKGKWILSLDLDEYLPTFYTEELLTYLSGDIEQDGYLVNIAHNTKETLGYLHKAVRLFKNTEYADWYGIVHEEPINLTNIGTLSITLVHNGYNIDDLEHKYRRNLPLLIKQLATMDMSEDKYEFYLRYLKDTLENIKFKN